MAIFKYLDGTEKNLGDLINFILIICVQKNILTLVITLAADIKYVKFETSIIIAPQHSLNYQVKGEQRSQLD